MFYVFMFLCFIVFMFYVFMFYCFYVWVEAVKKVSSYKPKRFRPFRWSYSKAVFDCSCDLLYLSGIYLSFFLFIIYSGLILFAVMIGLVIMFNMLIPVFNAILFIVFLKSTFMLIASSICKQFRFLFSFLIFLL